MRQEYQFMLKKITYRESFKLCINFRFKRTFIVYIDWNVMSCITHNAWNSKNIKYIWNTVLNGKCYLIMIDKINLWTDFYLKRKCYYSFKMSKKHEWIGQNKGILNYTSKMKFLFTDHQAKKYEKHFLALCYF